MSIAAGEFLAICSQCGYDLRGITSERCPECGFEIARQQAIGGEIPWTYRRAGGRVRMFFETVWKVTWGGPWIRRVVAGPVSTRDARHFWLIATAVASLPLVGFFAYLWLATGGAAFRYIPDASLAGMSVSTYVGFGLTAPADLGIPAWIRADLIWPISAGWTVPGVGPLVLWLFVLLGSGSMTYLFHPRTLAAPHRQRASAFAYYLCAPLVLAAIPLAVVLVCIVYATLRDSQIFSPPMVLAALALLVFVVMLVVAYLRLLATLAHLPCQNDATDRGRRAGAAHVDRVRSVRVAVRALVRRRGESILRRLPLTAAAS